MICDLVYMHTGDALPTSVYVSFFTFPSIVVDQALKKPAEAAAAKGKPKTSDPAHMAKMSTLLRATIEEADAVKEVRVCSRVKH